MNFIKHSNLEGQHAFLGASKYHWIRYDDEKLLDTYDRFLATLRGTELHDFAAICIKLNQKLPKSQKTLNMYVNDAIGYKMTPEQILYYSDNCFGTADAICFRDNFLRIHDLKTGKIPAHFVHNPTADEIVPIMDKIITFDKLINKRKREESL